MAAAARGVLAAAAATVPAREAITPRRQGYVGPAWSGLPGGPLLHTRLTRQVLRNGTYWWGTRSRGPPPSRCRLRAAYGVLEELLGGRPLLACAFGDDAMNPVGGVLLVRWRPDLAVGFLLRNYALVRRAGGRGLDKLAPLRRHELCPTPAVTAGRPAQAHARWKL